MSSSLALPPAPPSKVEEEAQAEKAACLYLATHVDPLLTKILTELLLHKPQNVLQALLNFFQERQGQGTSQQLYQEQQQQQQHYGMPSSSYDGVRRDKGVYAEWLAQLSSVEAKQGAVSVNRWYAVHHVLPILSRLVRHLVVEQPTTEAALDDSVVTFLIHYQQQQQQERDGDQDEKEIEKQKQPQQQDPVKEATTPSSSSSSSYLEAIHVLVLGLEGAGKSSIVAALQGELDPEVHPTSGMNVISITSSISNSSVVKFHDVGGSTASQAQWPSFYHFVHALLWVTDATQATHWKEEREVLRNCLEHPFLAGKPCLLLVNKQDTSLPHYSSARIYQEVAPCFATAEEARGLLRVEGCIANATQNYGILDSSLEVGLTWLLEFATKHAAALEARVCADTCKVEEEEGRAKANKEEQGECP